MRVTQHKETPGLGDYIQLSKSPWVLQFDGGCDFNGTAHARGRWAYRIQDRNRLVTKASGPAVGSPVTNNTAEWQGLVEGLQAVGRYEPGTCPGILLIEGDSDLVISQLTGRWRAKAGPLEEWRDRALDVIAGLYVAWHARWIPRAKNDLCDAMTRLHQAHAEG